MARRAAAMAQEGVRAVRGTGDAEADLANAKADYAEEAREIASYRALEALAEALGDRQTAMLAKRLRREEERMAASLEKLIPELVRAAVREEIAPPRPPGTAGAAKRRSRSSSRARAGTSRAPAARKPTARRPRASARKS